MDFTSMWTRKQWIWSSTRKKKVFLKKRMSNVNILLQAIKIESYCADVNRNSRVRLLTWQWEVTKWVCVLSDRNRLSKQIVQTFRVTSRIVNVKFAPCKYWFFLKSKIVVKIPWTRLRRMWRDSWWLPKSCVFSLL